MTKDLRYPMRRILVAFLASTAVSALLFVFLCPVEAAYTLDIGHVALDLPYPAFRPIWRRGGDPIDPDWLGVESAVALVVGFCAWYVYPHFKPPPPPEPRSADRRSS
jgi:hypothetical protein